MLAVTPTPSRNTGTRWIRWALWCALATVSAAQDDGGDGGEGGGGPPAPPGSPPTQKFTGPWFSTQLILSLSIGLTSFFVFCFLRTRWEVVYMGRTKLKDFSPTPAHTPETQTGGRFFGWILPTLRTSEFTVLQTVGLDAAVLLNFFRMSFVLFSLAAFLATVVLMPLNLFRHGSTDSEPDVPSNDTSWLHSPPPIYFSSPTLNSSFPTLPVNTTRPVPSVTDLILDPQTYATVNLIFAYIFTFLVLTFLHRNFHRFVLARQSFALHLIHSISARTVMVSKLPAHLRGDRALAEYFEGCGWTVESVSVCREIGPLMRALERRTNALLKLEEAWAEWVGNPAGEKVHGYDPNIYQNQTLTRALTASPRQTQSQSQSEVVEPLIPGLEDPHAHISRHGMSNGNGTASRSDSASTEPEPEPELQSEPEQSESSEHPQLSGGVEIDIDPETGRPHVHIHTTRPRPTFRPRWFGTKVDAIEHWEAKYVKADEEVRELRKKGMFPATHAAFVTLLEVKDAVVHYPHHSQVITEPAPEPRDVVWKHVSMSPREFTIRNFVVMGVMILLLLTWIAPVTGLATLLSYDEIKKVAPWLARMINASPRLAAIVQNSLPSLAIISFNGLLPFLLGWISDQQGFKSRSTAEYSLLRKYHLFLVVSVLFIFLLTTTYWALVIDLADSPGKIPEKLAAALQTPNARNFMVSYVMLQALGLMPMQLLNLGPLLSLATARAFWTKTPRDYAEANAPPMLNYGWVYPQALLVFTITLVYSVVSPLILVFGAIYFGNAYLVFKYKLLFVYFKPYESNGEAWRITFNRLLWALITFQLFMTGIFLLSNLKPPILALAMTPLILYTLWWSWTMIRDFGGLSRFLALSSICEVERGEGADVVAGVRGEDGVSRSQSNLNHRRYAMNDETLYVAPSDSRTDYSQPPMSSFYYGVLNTGRRRYAHPALSGLLPTPWLPAKKKKRQWGDGAKARRGVVLSLRRKMAKRLRRQQESGDGDGEGDEGEGESGGQGSGAGVGTRSGLPEGWATGDVWGASTSTGGGGGAAPGGTGENDRDRDRLASSQASSSLNPWRDPTPPPSEQAGSGRGRGTTTKLRNKLSFDPGSGVIAMPEENVWDDEADEDDEEEEGDGGAGQRDAPASPSTYFPHPERRRSATGSNPDMS